MRLNHTLMQKPNPAFYLNAQGLSEAEHDAVLGMIMRLRFATDDFIWTPGNCRALPEYTERANSAHKEAGMPKYFGPLVEKRFDRIHFFWTSSANDGRKLIIDTTGFPAERAAISQPYFGIADYAPGLQKRVYSRMQDMDKWGTRIFPPTFRP